MLSIRLQSTGGYLVVKFWEGQKLYVDFRLHGRLTPLTFSVLFKSQLYIEPSLCPGEHMNGYL